MTTTVSPIQNDVYTALGNLLVAYLPVGTPVVRGIDNRVPMPGVDPYVLMQALFTQRLRTNVDVVTPTLDPAPADGTGTLEQGMRIDVQLDFYGPDSGNWAAIISTILRDDLGCTALAPTCQPLYADEARMAPLVTGEEQYLERWTLTATLQYNPTVTVSQQYADAASVTVINVDEAYPP